VAWRRPRHLEPERLKGGPKTCRPARHRPNARLHHLPEVLAARNGGSYGDGVVDYSRFIKPQIASRTYRPDGSVETTREPAVWTLAHRGYSGGGRLDVWAYALYEGARLAMACGMDEDEAARQHFEAGRYQKVLDRYEATHPETHLLRVQTAFLSTSD
jgi:hypothetical protein